MATILAVDDEHDMRNRYYHTLERREGDDIDSEPLVGQVIIASNADDALAWYERKVTPAQLPCDLIITGNDMGMKEDLRTEMMSGLEFLAVLQARYSQLPPRLLISHANHEPRMRHLHKAAQERGAVGVYNGYFEEDELRTIARELIEHRGVSPTLDKYFVEQGWKE